MIDGLVLSVALLVSPGAATPAPSPSLNPRPLSTAAFAYEPPRPAALPGTRTIWRGESFRATHDTAAKQSTKTDRVIAIVAGVAGGWILGGAIGYYATQDRDRDDDGTSGLKGVVIGAPIGAAIGGFLGYRLTRN